LRGAQTPGALVFPPSHSQEARALMSDMLVSLLDLPSLQETLDAQRAQDIVIRRAFTFEISRVRQFVEEHFGMGWAHEISVGFARMPTTVVIAIDQSGEKKKIVGFAAYEC